MKEEKDRWKYDWATDWTIEEVWASFPNGMNRTMKVQEILKEGLEKAFENHDNMY